MKNNSTNNLLLPFISAVGFITMSYLGISIINGNEQSQATAIAPNSSDASTLVSSSSTTTSNESTNSSTIASNQRGDVSFVLINNTGRTIERFYASPTNVDNWEEDIFEDGVLYDRGRIEITIEDQRQDCRYDFLAVVGPSADGNVGRGKLYQTNINICDTTVYEYWDNSGMAMN